MQASSWPRPKHSVCRQRLWVSDRGQIPGACEQLELGRRVSGPCPQLIRRFIRGSAHLGCIVLCFMSRNHDCWLFHDQTHMHLCLAEAIGDER